MNGVQHTDFCVRVATDKDLAGLTELYDGLDAYHREALPQVFRTPDQVARSVEYFQHIMAESTACLLVADADGQVIGGVLAYLRHAPDYPIFVPRCYGFIDTLVVHPAYRHLGIGGALMHKVHQWMLDNKAEQCELNVWEFNSGAKDFYTRLGYETASRKLWKNLK